MKNFKAIFVAILFAELVVEFGQSKPSLLDEMRRTTTVKPNIKYMYLRNNVYEISGIDKSDWTAKGWVYRDDFNETG